MRAPFNRQIDLIWGPGWPDAGDVRIAAMPARVVPDLVFTEQLPPMGDSLAYFTCEADIPFSPAFVPDGIEQYIWSSHVADRVALITGGVATHYVVRLELRTRLPSPSYWRAHIAPIPSPLTPCQESYAQVYEFEPVVPGWLPLTRIGPTTWVYEGWTLYAEVSGEPAEGCFSTWRLINSEEVIYEAYWDGTAEITFVGPFPLYESIYVRVPTP